MSIFTESVKKALKSLPPQQRDVLMLRFGLSGAKTKTLQDIGNSSNITRERVRQIQNNGLTNLMKDICFKNISSAVTSLRNAIGKCGGVADEDTLFTLLKIKSEKEKNSIRLLLTASQEFVFQKEDKDTRLFWSTGKKEQLALRQALNFAHKQIDGKKEKIFTRSEMLSILKDALAQKAQGFSFNPEYLYVISNKIGSNVYDEFGHISHPEIALSSLGGCINLIMRKKGTPMHFNEIAKETSKVYSKKVVPSSCHNELVRSDKFILVGNGTYALRSNGYRPGTTRDIIELILKEVGGTLPKRKIIEEVSKERFVKEQTISQLLATCREFKRDSNGNYFFDK